MTMIHISNCRLKKFLMILLSIGFLIAFSVPAMAAAIPLRSSTGSAKIFWDPAPTFGCLEPGATIHWLEKNSFSGAFSGLNRRETDPGQSDYFEGVPPDALANWVATSFVGGLFDPFGSATGYADTLAGFPYDPNIPAYLDARSNRADAKEIFATSDVNLKLLGEGDVFIAQAVLEGLFYVSGGDCTLQVSKVGYDLQQTLTSTLGKSAFSDVAVALAVYDMDVTDPTTGNNKILAEDKALLENDQFSLFTRTKSYPQPGGQNGFLQIPPVVLHSAINFDNTTNPPYPLDHVYDFEASASTIAAAGLSVYRGFPFWWWHRFLVK
jgi:hypothetical protein